jgi:hypothetical protein
MANSNRSCIEKLADTAKDGVKHRLGQSARERVLLAGMIRSDQRDSIIQITLGSMSEPETLGTRGETEFLKGRERRIKSDATKRHHDAHISQEFNFSQQEGTTISYFVGQRLVSRRRAMHGRCDVAVTKLQAVVAMNGRGLISKSEFVKGAIEPLAAAVTGEHPPGAISAVRRWRKPNDEQSRARVTKAWHRLAPIRPLAITVSFFFSDALSPCHQSRALSAINDLLLYVGQSACALHDAQ